MLLRTLITTVLKAYLTYEAQLSCLKKKEKKKKVRRYPSAFLNLRIPSKENAIITSLCPAAKRKASLTFETQLQSKLKHLSYLQET